VTAASTIPAPLTPDASSHGAVGLRLPPDDSGRQHLDRLDHFGVGPRVALLVGSGACLVAAGLAAFVHTPPNPDAALTDLDL